MGPNTAARTLGGLLGVALALLGLGFATLTIFGALLILEAYPELLYLFAAFIVWALLMGSNVTADRMRHRANGAGRST